MSSSSTMNPVSLLLQLHSDKRLNAEAAIRGDFICISSRYFNKEAITKIKISSKVSSFYTLEGLFNSFKNSGNITDMADCLMKEENKEQDSPPAIRRQLLASEEIEEKFPLMLLPDELIVNILSFLKQPFISYSVSVLCKRMKMICLDPDLWTRLVFPKEQMLSQERAAAVLQLDRCKKINELDVSVRLRDGERLIMEVLTRSKKPLKKLKVYECSLILLQAISESSITNLLIFNAKIILMENIIYLSNLTELSLCAYKWPLTRYHCKNLMAAIGHHCRKLVAFRFGAEISPEAVTALLTGSGDFGLCRTLRELSFCYIHTCCMVIVVTTCPALSQCALLEKLIASLPQNDSLASRRDFKLICNNLDRLETLQLNCCDQLTSSDYVNAFSDRKLGKLRKLKLNRCVNLNNEGLYVLAENCPNLTYLSLSHSTEMSNIGLRRVLTNCRHLEKLELWYIRKSGWSHNSFGDVTLIQRWTLTSEAFKGVDTPAFRWLAFSRGAFTEEEIEEIKRDRPLLSVIQ